MTNYYNENDPQTVAILKQLIADGVVPAGDVDDRSIEDVEPYELYGYTQCHFFAGIGGWAYALQLAGWSADLPVWTGSCPCQPFSQAGKGDGFADERHLWPAWYWLIQQLRPAIVFGEQVASKNVDPWVDLVHADMEAMGHAFGCVAFPAAGIGAPHIRDRSYWVAHADLFGQQIGNERESLARGWQKQGSAAVRQSDARRLADLDFNRRPAASFRELHDLEHHVESRGGVERLGHADSERTGRITGAICGAQAGQGRRRGSDDAFAPGTATATGPTNGIWRDADWLACRDGKWRPVESGSFPLAHGVPGRVGRLRGYGNAIVPQAAAEFIQAFIFAKAMRQML